MNCNFVYIGTYCAYTIDQGGSVMYYIADRPGLLCFCVISIAYSIGEGSVVM